MGQTNFDVVGTKVAAKAASFTVDSKAATFIVDATAAAVVATLPTAARAKKRRVTIKKVDASVNTVTIDGAGAETIEGAATLVISAQYGSYTIQSNGVTWWIVSKV